MPTFTAIALDSLIEPGAPKSMPPSNPKLERRNSTPTSGQDRYFKVERGVSVPPKLDRGLNIPPNPRNGRRNGAPPTSTSTNTSVVDKTNHWTQISPALYATPESTPLPDSPSSFPPSPYIINHKRRGPRLNKSFSEEDVATFEQSVGDGDDKVDGNGKDIAVETVCVAEGESVVPSEVVESVLNDEVVLDGPGDVKETYVNRTGNGESGYTDESTNQNGVPKSVAFNLQQNCEVDDFFDPQDSMSIKSLGESESNGGVERSLNSTTPLAEFYDAWEELSSESGPQHSVPDFENELRETRLSLLMEIEKRKIAEETLISMRNQWQRIRQQFSLVGLTLPEDPTMLHEGEQAAEEVTQQVYLARFVSNSIGRGMAKAEVEMEMEAQIKLKNSEIARLWDRLHYYEAVNQEMSQRNQEVVETARRVRQRRRRRQKWIWGSVATLVTLGSAAFAYSFFQSGKGSSSPTTVSVPEVDRKSK